MSQTLEQMKARIAELESQLAARTSGKLVCKVSEKGAVSIYGLQRMPVTLYGEQWKRLIEFAPEVSKFIAANQDKLATKGNPIDNSELTFAEYEVLAKRTDLTPQEQAKVNTFKAKMSKK